MPTVYTFISAVSGDRVPGHELAELEVMDYPPITRGALAWLVEQPEVITFFAENNYNGDRPHELMHLAVDEVGLDGWPTLTVTVPDTVPNTVPAGELAKRLPDDQLTWCVWDADDREAPLTVADLEGYFRKGGIDSDNGFSMPDDTTQSGDWTRWSDPSRAKRGMAALLADLAAGKTVYLALPDSEVDHEKYHDDDDDGRLRFLWEGFSEFFLEARFDDLDRYSLSWIVVRWDAPLPAPDFSGAAQQITRWVNRSER